MKNYKTTYFRYFGYSEGDWIPCECGCGQEAVDIHHLVPKSLSKAKVNLIDNLCAVSRECHIRADKDRTFNEYLKLKHRKLLLGVKTDHETERYL
jgi:hypothetical protein